MSYPKDVGILAMECIFPCQYVDQADLEKFDSVPAGKYTIGLGQARMGFCTDVEDINSLCLTAVNNLMERHQISYNKVGRLEVGTETILDKSKSIKSILMQLFEESGNHDIEGVDTTNACYGGTAALFNAVNWIESSSWDHRYALVVAADIAVYAKGSARPTGGAGAIAMLIGPNAPLVLDRGNRSTYMQHAYDFYKPDLRSEYPTVDGKLSIKCYLNALDHCYQLFCKKTENAILTGDSSNKVTLGWFDAVLFHTPYCKLVQKSLARLLFNDFKMASEDDKCKYSGLEPFTNTSLEDTYFDRDVEKAAMALSLKIYEEKTKPYLLLANQVGNMYTPSLYGGLVSLLISRTPEQLSGKRIGLFSYGSGLASSMYSLLISPNAEAGSSLNKLCSNLADVRDRLDARVKFTPEQFTQVMDMREKAYMKAPYQPTTTSDKLFPGTWFLVSVDDMHRRAYSRKPCAVSEVFNARELLSSEVKAVKEQHGILSSALEHAGYIVGQQ